jgi:hypothetical protein
MERDDVPVYIVGHTNGLVFFKFKTDLEKNNYETGLVRTTGLFKEGKRAKTGQTNTLKKLEEFLKDLPFGIGTQPCHATIGKPKEKS